MNNRRTNPFVKLYNTKSKNKIVEGTRREEVHRGQKGERGYRMWTSQRSLLWREGREWHCGVALWQALFLCQPSTAPTYIRPFSQKPQLWQSKLSCSRAQWSPSFHLARQGINKTSLGSMATSSSERHLAIGGIHGLEQRGPSQSCKWLSFEGWLVAIWPS